MHQIVVSVNPPQSPFTKGGSSPPFAKGGLGGILNTYRDYPINL
jgi:hypothetical protein